MTSAVYSPRSCHWSEARGYQGLRLWNASKDAVLPAGADAGWYYPHGSYMLREIWVELLKPGGRLAILEFGEPRVPVLRSIYLWYFRQVLPRIGRLLSRHAEAYAYLPASVSAFLTPDAFVALLRETGFSELRVDRLTCGVVYLYVGCKPAGG